MKKQQKTLTRRREKHSKNKTQNLTCYTQKPELKTWISNAARRELETDKNELTASKGRQGLFKHEVGEHRWNQLGAGLTITMEGKHTKGGSQDLKREGKR